MLDALTQRLSSVVKTLRGHSRITEDNVQEHLAVRNLMQSLRGGGENVGGPAALNASDRHAFANQLDRLLTARGSPEPSG